MVPEIARRWVNRHKIGECAPNIDADAKTTHAEPKGGFVGPRLGSKRIFMVYDAAYRVVLQLVFSSDY